MEDKNAVAVARRKLIAELLRSSQMEVDIVINGRGEIVQTFSKTQADSGSAKKPYNRVIEK